MTEERAPKDKTYHIPSEVAFALTTRRPQLLRGLRERVSQGESLPVEAQAGILDLVADLITDLEHQRERNEKLVVTIRGEVGASVLLNLDQAAARIGKAVDNILDAYEDTD